MATIATFTKTGTKATTPAKLDKTIFGLEIENHELLKAAYVAYLANGRGNSAVTKTRGLVSGGGRKPWRQKGTGRARFGSSRNPIWRGGGIAFGPTGEENYTHKFPVAQKRQAIRQALSMAATDDRIIIIEDVTSQNGKTSELTKLLTKLNVSNNTLIVVEDKTDTLVRASQNVSHIKLVQARYLNVFDIMNANHIVITNGALQAIELWLGAK
jgi:large subunit ribosomal protein L4